MAWGLGVVGFALGYGVGLVHLGVVRRRRSAAWRDRALRHH